MIFLLSVCSCSAASSVVTFQNAFSTICPKMSGLEVRDDKKSVNYDIIGHIITGLWKANRMELSI